MIDEGMEPIGEGSARSSDNPARKLFLAWLGAMATAYDTTEDTFERFVRRGEQVQDELEHRTQDVTGGAESANMRMRDSIQMLSQTIRDQLNVPSKTEIDAINVKLNIVLRKLDDLSMAQTMGVTPPPEPPSDIVP
ncbi:MAG TPA: phasin family protein [Chloroflexota bacterium]|nr:phasin family protein [Chloroflexota bacterium]